MIKNTNQIKTRHRWNEFERRQEASSNEVQSLTTQAILEALKVKFTKEELRAEIKRRRERLRYLKIISNPYTRSLYRARKKAEREARNA